MMIALAILAMGLLVIGAALPVGVRYTQATVNQATGEAAGEFALDLLAQASRIPQDVWDLNATDVTRATGLFVPRLFTTPAEANHGKADLAYEPVIKVHALYSAVVQTGKPNIEFLTSAPSLAVREWLTKRWGGWTALECDPNFLRPALASVSSVFPPISCCTRRQPSGFLSRKYDDRFVNPCERAKALEQRFAWTAFYRRVSYGPGSDPMLYEWIVAVSRLPSPRHRFPVQDPVKIPSNSPIGSKNPANQIGDWSGEDTGGPVPWLVTFDNTAPLPAPPGGIDPATGVPIGPAPATLQFKCRPTDSGLFPVGAIFLPARNDKDPNALLPNAPRVLLAPPAPSTLPIYEVVQRPNETTILVKYNGFYPAKRTTNGYAPLLPGEAASWPVWVVPPAYEELENNIPLADGHAAIVAVARRYVHMRELP